MLCAPCAAARRVSPVWAPDLAVQLCELRCRAPLDLGDRVGVVPQGGRTAAAVAEPRGGGSAGRSRLPGAGWRRNAVRPLMSSFTRPQPRPRRPCAWPSPDSTARHAPGCWRTGTRHRAARRRRRPACPGSHPGRSRPARAGQDAADTADRAGLHRVADVRTAPCRRQSWPGLGRFLGGGEVFIPADLGAGERIRTAGLPFPRSMA